MSRSLVATPWKLNGIPCENALEVAAKLASLEVIADLRYRAVVLEAHAIEITPCHDTAADIAYRVYVLRLVSRPPLWQTAGRLPEEWQSPAIGIPRRPRGALAALFERVRVSGGQFQLLRGS